MALDAAQIRAALKRHLVPAKFTVVKAGDFAGAAAKKPGELNMSRPPRCPRMSAAGQRALFAFSPVEIRAQNVTLLALRATTHCDHP